MKNSQYILTFNGFEQPISDEFLAVMNFLDHPIICLTPDFRITQINESAANFFQVSATNLSNKNFKEFCEQFAMQNFTVFKQKIDIFDGKVITNYITPVLIDNKTYQLQWLIARQLNSQRKPIGFVLSFRDVSVEKKLHNLQNVMRSLPGHVYWKDKNGTFLGCNEQQARDAGLTIEQMVGKTDDEMPWKADAKLLQKIDSEVIATGFPKIVEEQASQLANCKNRIFLTHKVPLRDEKGKVIGVLGVSFDITERKQAEQKLKKTKEKIETEDKAKKKMLRQMAEQITGLKVKANRTPEEYAKMMADYYESLVAALPGNVYWMNREGVYLGCNDNCAKYHKITSRKKIVGKKVYDLYDLSNQDIAKIRAKLHEKIMSTGISEPLEETRLTNPKKTFLTHKVPLHDKQGKVIGLLGISFDITKRKQMEKDLAEAKERAERSDKLKMELLENMRHDVRTPLTGIIGFADLIKSVAQNPKMSEYADNLIASGKALLSLLNGILETVKLASGKIPFVQKKFSLKEQLESIMQLNQTKAKEKNLQFNLNYDENIPRYLIGDPFRVHRIILELVGNALNFTDSGFVKVSALLGKKKGKKIVVKLIVEDTGIGIPKDCQESIFVRFKKLKPSYKSVYRGLGLGLSVVRQFLEEMNGEIYVTSALNQGTTFTCVIPLKKPLLEDDNVGVSSVPQTEIVQLRATKGTKKALLSNKKDFWYRLLVVEDDVFAAEVEKSILSDLKNKVDIARDGKTALALYKKNDYDLIFMDIGLPDMNGYKVTREIRLAEGIVNRQVPIIALSAHTDTVYKKRCIESGMSAVLSKPLFRERADDVLNTFIPGRRKAMEEKGEVQPKPTIINKDLLKLEGNVIDVNFMKKQLEYTDAAVKKFPPLLAKVLLNEDRPAFDKALEQKNWVIVQQVAHKIKGAATYGGALRLKEACHRLEKYLDEGQRDLALDLSDLVSKEIKAVIDYVKKSIRSKLPI